MGVVISISRKKAFFRDGLWRCSDAHIESSLNRDTDQWILSTGGPAQDSPDPELEIAREMVRRHGGRLVLRAQAPAAQSSRDLFHRRQFKLEFD